jgi:hypothetical protein
VIFQTGSFFGWWNFHWGKKDTLSEIMLDDKKNAQAEPILLVCDVVIKLPVDGWDKPPEVHNKTLVAGFDLKSGVGWYQGLFAISETRKGMMKIESDHWKVSRPGMFPRFGGMVTSEEFSINKKTGEFKEYLHFSDGRNAQLISGYCGKLLKAPF